MFVNLSMRPLNILYTINNNIYEMSTNGIDLSARLNMVLEKAFVSISRDRKRIRLSSCSSFVAVLIRPCVRLFNKAGANIFAVKIKTKVLLFKSSLFHPYILT